MYFSADIALGQTYIITSYQIMHDTVQVKLARAEDDVFTALLNFGCEQRIRLVHFSQPVQHFRQLRRVHGLHGDLHHRLCVELQGPVF